jgi:hypothetical protein
VDSLVELVPGREAGPAWLERHHKTDATIANRTVVVIAIQNARR